MNSEGYKDPTAEKAIHNAGYLPEHIWEPLKLIKKAPRYGGTGIDRYRG